MYPPTSPYASVCIRVYPCVSVCIPVYPCVSLCIPTPSLFRLISFLLRLISFFCENKGRKGGFRRDFTGIIRF